MKLLNVFMSVKDLTAAKAVEETNASAFDAASVAMDRAIEERRNSGQDRRTGSDDNRPPGSPEWRSGKDRRGGAQTPFGKRGMSG